MAAANLTEIEPGDELEYGVRYVIVKVRTRRGVHDIAAEVVNAIADRKAIYRGSSAAPMSVFDSVTLEDELLGFEFDNRLRELLEERPTLRRDNLEAGLIAIGGKRVR